MEGSHDHA